jgi:PTS system mannose-specific IIB component
MPIVLIRVDDRLVHGQIIEAWIPSTRAEVLLIANDALAQDELQKMILEAAIPYSITLVIDSVDNIASVLLRESSSSARQMVIVDNPKDALRLKKAGVNFDRLNLGNLAETEYKTCLSRSIAVGEECLNSLRDILEEGIVIDIQSVPFEKAVELNLTPWMS